MKGLLRLKSCCCGCSLRTGTLLIGFIGVFLQTVFSVLVIITIVRNATGQLEFKKYIIFKYGYHIGGLGILEIVGIGYVIVDILLLLGVYMKKLTFVNVYIWITFIWLWIHFVATLLFVENSFYGVVVSLILLALEFYCLLIVNSYYCTIKEEEINVTTV